MRTSLTAIALTLALSAVPVVAQAFDAGTLTPRIDFPEPVTEPVSKDRSDLDD